MATPNLKPGYGNGALRCYYIVTRKTLFVTEHLQPLKKILLLIINMLCMHLLASLCHDRKVINIYNELQFIITSSALRQNKIGTPRNK